MANTKRKRNDRTNTQDDGRPSPHRPENLRMGHSQQHQYQHQHQHQYQQNSPRGGGGGRRQSRNNGRGGSSVPQSPIISHTSPTGMSTPVNSFQPSKPAPTLATPTTPAPPNNQPLAPTPTTEVPGSNEYLTPQRIANWNSSARDAVVLAAVTAQRSGDALTLSVIFHEIIEATIDRQLGTGELGSIVRDIVASPSDDDLDPISTFLDTLSSLTQDKNKQALVQQMLLATDIDVSRMRNELESDLLGSLGLVRDTFARVAVRKATHALYRQSNYNLLREETEGYSKLMTEYFTTVNSEPPTQEVVSETYQRVNALIGAFDLDIGRVLDVTLDVFANLLVKHGKFFVKFLRSSAWWPELRGLEGIEWAEPDVTTLPQWAQPTSPQWYYSDEEKEEQLQLREERDRKFWQRVGALGERAGIQAYFELGSRRIVANNRQPDHTVPTDGEVLSKQQAARKWADEWIDQTNTLPPPSNDIAAQLLGFKLRFYASDARDAQDFLPDNLIYLAALLIKIGFISIVDLYPHLYPLEEDMPTHKERLLKAKKEKDDKERGTVRNALTMAGALPDDTLPGVPAVSRIRDAASKSESERSTPAKTDEATDRKPVLPEPADQKYQLLKSLLCIGALPEALFILGRHPWLLDVYSDLSDYIFRIAHHSLSKIYDATRAVPADHAPVVSKGAGLRSPPRPSDFVPRRTLRWAKPDVRDAGDGTDYKFYWEDWVDNIPVCQEVDDVLKLCTSLLGLLGPECGKDIVLLTKIIRIGLKSLADNSSDANRKCWIHFSSTFIAPALSYTGKNPGIINEAWELFKQFDTATRYTIYQQWFTSTKPPSLRAVFEQVRASTNHELGRVASKNTKEYGRKIAKISYASPGIVFQLTLKRLINYPNMIDTLVECVRYITLLGYDCLTWTMVNFFIKPEKGGTQGDGMLAAPWLKNIASFVGKAYQRHSFMDPTPILQFITQQVLQPEGDLYMLDVLEQMIKSMGGISIYGSLSESMILSLSAGPILRTFTFQHHLSDNRHQAGTSARRLTRYLKETGLAPQILIALAQHLEAYVYRSDQQDVPDKVVLFNLDKLRSNLLQYLELLRAYIPVEEFDELFPGPIEMISDYRVEPDMAFTIARASIAAKANQFRKRHVESASQSNGDVEMGEADDKVLSNSTGTTSGAAESSTDVDMSDANDSTQGILSVAAGQPLINSANPAIETLVTQIKDALPDTFGGHPCLSLYVTFWQLSLADVDNGGFKQQYQNVISHFERQLPPPVPERRGYNQSMPRKETDEMRRAKIEIAKLKMEQQEVTLANNLTQSHLRLEMRQWFEGVPMVDARNDAILKALLQDCFLPRSCMSLQDASFAAAMLKFMHSSGVPGFRTLKLLDLLFNGNKLACIISMYSDEEALTFGRFINSILRELLKWHENKDDAYAKFAHGPDKKLPGFGRRFDSDRNPTDHLQYDDFCKVLFKWHKALFTALKGCLDTGDFQQIRNSLVILTACSGSFPKVDTMALELKQAIEPLARHDERGDIKTTAGSSLALFRDPEKNFQPHHKFCNVPEPARANPIVAHGTSETATARSSTPQSQDASTTRHKSTAPTFNKSRPESNGVQSTQAESTDDDEQKRATPTPTTYALHSREREHVRPSSKLHDPRATTPSKQDKDNSTLSAGAPVAPTSLVPPRPEGRHTPQPGQANRAAHALPIRPDSQPRSRQPERSGGVERPPDHGHHGRYDNRGPPNDYGRLDRSNDPSRPRDGSPGRRGRPVPGGRTPERIPPVVDHREWPTQNTREYDDRGMRAPLRDARAPPVRPPTWDSRDTRDPRDQRERPDSRGHPGPPAMEPRRMPSNSSLAHEHSSHRRDLPPLHSRQGQERGDHGPARVPFPPSPVTDGPTVNPARAALINQEEHGRQEGFRPDRDNRRERGPQAQSPRGSEDKRTEDRRGEDRHVDERLPPIYHGRSDGPREHRDERGPTHAHSNSRDRRDEPITTTPTGPRSGRNEPTQPVGASREMFQPPRPSRNSTQDPNYGRLTQPADPMPPSGPRGTYNTPIADVQSLTRSGDRPHPQSQPPVATPPSGPAASVIHPSRLEQIQRDNIQRDNLQRDNIQRMPPSPALQTNMPNAPSGPRGNGRANQGPLQSPINRGPPTGPASSERGPRGGERRNPLGAINSLLTQNAPTPEIRSNDRSTPTQNPPIRGRGASRVNGPMEATGGMASQMPPPHVSIPSSRVDGQHGRNGRAEIPPNRMDGTQQEDGRSESHGHSRRERSGRDQSRSDDHNERRPDERSNRNGSSRTEGEERGPERDRSSREKRGSERESGSRRDRDREGGERSTRDSNSNREPREPREGGRRERGSREDGRTSGRDDRRSRGGGGGAAGVGGGGGAVADDGRKRGRDPQDQGQGHGEAKRRR
ncbi:transcription factor/nuclear export subunit protein 2-domain-containing protein [Phaeosphaeriaceae sp. PMI808]|nr:transcription factor/nuclear export subunit protein 2-domain-containing protein [Phaeosphaeriaceae sp. PMI808]